MIRLFQFKSNFMLKKGQAVSAEYSSIGYFDGLDMREFDEEEEVLNNPVQMEQSEKERCDILSIAGMRKEENTAFWEKNMPFLFVSFIRLKKAGENLECIVQAIESQFDACCYYTIDSSDLIICLKSDNYITAYNIIEHKYIDIINYDNKGIMNKVIKIYSIASLKQSVLDNMKQDTSSIQNETVSCNLRCVVKNWKCVKKYITELGDALSGCNPTRYGILGSDDIIIELKEVNILDILPLFGKKGLLVHNNKYYKGAFYNIKTEILVKQ